MSSLTCSTSLPADCAPAQCRWRCALEVIDELLGKRGGVSGDDADHLLELRWKLRQRDDAEAVLRLFCNLRLHLEQRHYLAFFRLRRWLENHLLASVRICPAAEAQFVPVQLNHYCVEAIRRVSLCTALRRDSILLAPRLRFTFRPVVATAPETLTSPEAALALVD